MMAVVRRGHPIAALAIIDLRGGAIFGPARVSSVAPAVIGVPRVAAAALGDLVTDDYWQSN